MEDTLTSGSGQPDDVTHPLADNSEEINKPSCSCLTRTVAFSSGNPRIEVTRRVMRLFENPPETPISVVHHLPAFAGGRSPFLCVLDVPNHTNYADFCQFCESFVQHILEMRILRNGGTDDAIAC